MTGETYWDIGSFYTYHDEEAGISFHYYENELIAISDRMMILVPIPEMKDGISFREEFKLMSRADQKAWFEGEIRQSHFSFFEEAGYVMDCLNNNGVAPEDRNSNVITGMPPAVGIRGVPSGVAVGRNAARKGLTNAELVTKVGQKAFSAIPGKGPVVGTARHQYATKLLDRHQSIYGNRGLEFNFYFNGPVGRGYLDVVDHSAMTIYDFKFGTARMRRGQFMKYSNSFPGYSIKIIRP